MFTKIKNLILSLFKKVESVKEEDKLLPEEMFFQSNDKLPANWVPVDTAGIKVYNGGKKDCIKVVNYDFLRRDVKTSKIISIVVRDIKTFDSDYINVDNFLRGKVDETFDKALEELDNVYSWDLRTRYDKKD